MYLLVFHLVIVLSNPYVVENVEKNKITYSMCNSFMRFILGEREREREREREGGRERGLIRDVIR